MVQKFTGPDKVKTGEITRPGKSALPVYYIRNIFLQAKKEARKRGEPRLLINTTIRRMEESKLKLVRAVIQ